MPCCLVVLLSIAIPRGMIIILFFTDWFKGVFSSAVWPILGFIFLPTSTLWYSAVKNWYDGVWGSAQILVMVLAVIFDLSQGGGSHRGTRERFRRKKMTEGNVTPL